MELPKPVIFKSAVSSGVVLCYQQQPALEEEAAKSFYKHAIENIAMGGMLRG